MATIGREVFVVKPSPENPRNTEGAFALLKDGSIMYAYSRFVGDSNDHADADIHAFISRDDGETWGEGRIIYKKGPNDRNVMSVSFLRMLDGALAMFFLRKVGDGEQVDCRPNMILSYDEGETWSEAKCCIDKPGYYVMNNDRILRLKNGRVILPVSYHEFLPQAGEFSDRGTACFFISDDDCKTFHEAKQRLELPFNHPVSGLQEVGVMELKDGRIWAFARTGHGYQFEAYSEDQGETWGDVLPNEFFTSPNSPMGVKRLQNGKMLAVFNPIPIYNGRHSVLGSKPFEHAEKTVRYNMYHPYSVYCGRTPLVCALSDGSPKEFEDYLWPLEDNRSLEFCYPAILPNKDYVLISYFIMGSTYDYPDEVRKTSLYGSHIRKVMLSEFED